MSDPSPALRYYPHKCARCDAPFFGPKCAWLCSTCKPLIQARPRGQCARCDRAIKVGGHERFCRDCATERRRANWRRAWAQRPRRSRTLGTRDAELGRRPRRVAPTVEGSIP